MSLALVGRASCVKISVPVTFINCTFPPLLFFHRRIFSCLRTTWWDGVWRGRVKWKTGPGSLGRMAINPVHVFVYAYISLNIHASYVSLFAIQCVSVSILLSVCLCLWMYLSVSLGRVNCVQFNEDSSLIISGSVDGTLRAWDCRSRRLEPVQVGLLTAVLTLDQLLAV